MRVAVIHPLKHHVYYSMAGVMESGAKVVGLFGYYDKNDFIDKIVRKTKWNRQIDGYKYDKISNHVKTNIIVKILFLLSKIQPRVFQKIYNWVFEIWVLYNMKDFDCIHVLQDYDNQVIRVARKKNLKIVYEQITAYCMERFFDEKTSIKEDMLQKENLQIVDYILTPSDFVKDSITAIEGNKHVEEKIVRIPYGVSVQQFQHQDKILKEGQELKLLIVASISEGKGMKYLLDAMEYLRGYPVKLSVIGASIRDEQSLIYRMKELDNVDYIGTIPHEQIYQYYNDNQVFILPSLAEGSSLSVYEALAAGLPCIVTKNTGSVVTDGIDGIVIEDKSADGIINAIRRFVENPELIQKMSLNTKDTIKKYTWDEYEKNIAVFYEKSVVGNRIS